MGVRKKFGASVAWPFDAPIGASGLERAPSIQCISS
jgi:hypothetical protein